MVRRHEDRKGLGPIRAIRDHSVLFVLLALMTFAGLLFIAVTLAKDPTIKARLRVEAIELDELAEDPASLTKPASFEADELRTALLATSPSGEATSTGAIPENADWRGLLTVTEADEKGEFVMELTIADAGEAVDWLDGLIARLIADMNERQQGLRQEALSWIQKRETVWQAKVDQAKAAILDNPFDPDPSRVGGQHASEKLLRLMLAALEETDKGQVPELASDVAQLNAKLALFERGQDAQLEYGTALRNAEAERARLQKEAGMLTAEGAIFDQPAVIILASAAGSRSQTFDRVRTIGLTPLLPALAVASLVLALLGTMLANLIWARPKVDAGTFLNDPNWPLPPTAVREPSI